MSVAKHIREHRQIAGALANMGASQIDYTKPQIRTLVNAPIVPAEPLTYNEPVTITALGAVSGTTPQATGIASGVQITAESMATLGPASGVALLNPASWRDQFSTTGTVFKVYPSPFTGGIDVVSVGTVGFYTDAPVVEICCRSTDLINLNIDGMNVPCPATSVTSITRVGNTATATLASATPLANGGVILIEGATGADGALYNGPQVIVSGGGTTTITYAMKGTPSASATGTLTARPTAISCVNVGGGAGASYATCRVVLTFTSRKRRKFIINMQSAGFWGIGIGPQDTIEPVDFSKEVYLAALSDSYGNYSSRIYATGGIFHYASLFLGVNGYAGSAGGGSGYDTVGTGSGLSFNAMVNGSPNIVVPFGGNPYDFQRFALGQIVRFGSTINGFAANTNYFVVSASTDGTAATIQLSPTRGGAAQNATGTSSGTLLSVSTFLERAGFLAAQTRKADIFIISGGINDGTFTNAATTFSALRAAAPNAILVVTGPWAPTTAYQSTAGSKRTTIRNALANIAGPWVFVDNVSGVWSNSSGASGFAGGQSGWQTGNGNRASFTGSGNGDFYVSSDALHPHPDGVEYLGRNLAFAALTGIAAL